MLKHFTCLALAAACFAAGGCGGAANVQQWQNNLEEYVMTQANGDLAALRHVTEPEARTFSVLGHANPENSTDLVGVLVGHPIVQDQPWAVFVLGTVDRGTVGQMRLVAVAQPVTPGGGGKLRWQIGEPDQAATSRYLQAHTDRPIWPHPADNFNLATGGATLRVTEQTSGATWSLTLPSHPPGRAPARAGVAAAR